MLLRRTRKAVGVLCLWMSSSFVIAQPPAAGPAETNVYPSDGSYLQDGVPIFDDELELWPQFRFQADWVYMTRQNRSSSLPVISGPDKFSLNDVGFNYSSGYRLNLGFMNDDFEVEGSFLQLDGLGGTQNGTLGKPLVFDGRDSYTNSTLAAQLAIDGDLNPNFLNSGTFFSPINAAANNVDAVTPANDETNELETLQKDAVYSARYTSNLQDFEVNFKGRQQPGRLLRFGVGYRNVKLNELGSIQLRGVFDTFDTDGDDSAGNNGPNDGLSNAALLGAGLSLTSGPSNGFNENVSPTAPDTLLFSTNTRAANVLNGLQGTLDASFFQSDYFELGAFGRAGVYYNQASGSVSETYRDLANPGSIYSRRFTDTKDQVAFVGNLGVTGRFRLRENVRLFTSYEVMFLSGVAVAPDQVRGIQTDISGTTSLDLQTNGNAVLYGGRVGIEILLP